jgi:hypothetical protein
VNAIRRFGRAIDIALTPLAADVAATHEQFRSLDSQLSRIARPGEKPIVSKRGLVAESMGYSVALYLDALFAVLVILVIPFLRDREDAPAMETVTAEPLLASE